MRKNSTWVLASVAIAILGLAALAIGPATRVSVDNRLERWLEPGTEDAQRYQRFRNRFGTDEFVLVAYGGKPFFDEPALAVQRAVLEQLEQIDHVQRVMGIPSVHRGVFDFQEAPGLEALFTGSPLYRGFLVNESASMVGMLVETTAPPDAAGRRRLVQDIDTTVMPLREFGWTVHLVGPPEMNAVLDQTSEVESRRVFPVALVCSAIMLLYLFRSLRATLIAAACSGISILLTLGLLGCTGRALNMVTAALPSLLWVLSLSNGIHLLRRYQVLRISLASPSPAMWRALAETAWPCALSAITTAMGFLSLTTATMQPARELGIFAAIGIMISLAVNLGLGPAMTLVLRVPAARRRHGAMETAVRIAGTVAGRYPKSVVTSSAVCAAFALGSLGHIRVESDPLAFLRPDSTTVRDYAAVCGGLTGAYSLELVIETPGGWDNPDYRLALEAVQHALHERPGVAKVISPLDVLEQMAQIENLFLPDTFAANPVPRWPAAQPLGNLGDDALSRLVSADGSAVRMSILVNAMDSRRFMQILATAEDALDALPPPLHGYPTGIVPRLVKAQLDLVKTQLRSFALAFVIVFSCIWIGLRSLKLMLVSIAPNLLPILAAFAAMALMGIALDAGTVMVASVALGIAVDDTVHFLSAFRDGMRTKHDKGLACSDALARVGPAMVITTATACAGFFALVRSNFVPIEYFGLLSGIAMVVALVADLLLAPALLLCLPWKKVPR